MKPLKLETWETGKNPYIRILAQSIAISAQGVLESLRDITNNTLPRAFEEPSLRTWIKFYRSHRRLWRFFTEQFLQFGGTPTLHAQVIQIFTQRLPPNHSLAISCNVSPKAAMPSVKEAYANFYSETRDEIADAPIAGNTKEIPKAGTKRRTAVDRFLKKLEKETI